MQAYKYSIATEKTRLVAVPLCGTDPGVCPITLDSTLKCMWHGSVSNFRQITTKKGNELMAVC